MIVSRQTPTACPVCHQKDLLQDPDVLDTWFSSWLWPFSTLGWPNKNQDLKYFYPTACLVTGYEIIFFWVARMIMAGIEFMGKEPFRHVYIHGIVRDETGAKMSKSLGNAVDPIAVINEFGADALRFAIISITAQGQDVYCSKEKFEVGRNFANKIWNASRFVAMKRVKSTHKMKMPKPSDFSIADRWILSRLHQTIDKVTDCLEKMRFNEASSVLYDFVWHQFCDWYLEIAKPNIESAGTRWTLDTVLEDSLKLLHPLMPFLTEEIWQSMPHKGPSIMISAWPKVDKKRINRLIESEMDLVIGEIQAIRNVRSAWQINPKQQVTVAIKALRDKELKILNKHSTTLLQMAKISSLKIGKNVIRPKESAVANIGRVETYVVLSGLVEIQVEQQRIQLALTEVEKMMQDLNGRLANEDFLKKAPKEIVEKERKKAEELENRRQRLEENLRTLTQ